MKEIDFCREAKKKIDIAVRRESPSGGMKLILAMRQRRIDIAVRRESPSGGMKLILAMRQRKIDYCREAKRKLITP